MYQLLPTHSCSQTMLLRRMAGLSTNGGRLWLIVV
jgi:hypothetical protein